MSEEYNMPTKRRVEITVGVPDLLEGAPIENHPEMPHHSECYSLTFVDKTEEDGCHNSLSAQVLCLCGVAEASKAWLNGATEEEVQAILVGGHDHDADHES